MYESGLREPNFENLRFISDILEVSLDYLLTGKEFKYKSVDINKKESGLIRNYRKLNNLGKKEAVKRVEELAEIPKYVTYKKEDLNAAHALDNSTDKEKANDDLIMDKDDEWTL